MRFGKWMAIAAVTAFPLAIGTIPATAQLVSALVNPLVANWIKSEVDSVDNLTVKISGADNELLGGRIDRAEVSGDNLVYEDFYFSRVELSGRDIRLTVEEALNGGSLNLVEPLLVDAMMRLTDDDLNRSLQALPVQSQLAETEVDIPFGTGEAVAFQLKDPQVEILDDRLKLTALLNSDGEDVSVSVMTGLLTKSSTQLQLVNPVWLQDDGSQIPIASLDGIAIELGSDVTIDRLQLLAGELIYNGTVRIKP